MGNPTEMRTQKLVTPDLFLPLHRLLERAKSKNMWLLYANTLDLVAIKNTFSAIVSALGGMKGSEDVEVEGMSEGWSAIAGQIDSLILQIERLLPEVGTPIDDQLAGKLNKTMFLFSSLNDIPGLDVDN